MKEKRSLSLSQKRFWLEWKWARSRAAYNTPLLFELEGELDVSKLEKALNAFVNHYDEGCRTTFEESKGGVFRVIHDEAPMVLEQLKGPVELLPLLRYDFDLTTLPLFKFVLIQLDDHKYQLLLNFHHIISDALSAKYFIDFLSKQYNQSQAQEQPKNKAAIFEEHVAFEQYNNASDATSLTYWEELLRAKTLAVTLPKKAIEQEQDNSESIYRSLSVEQTQLLKQVSRGMVTTPSILLTAVFGVLLARYSGESHVVLNYPIDMRRSFSKKAIGCFVNHVPCLIDLESSDSFSSLIAKLTQQRKNTKPHQYTSLMDVVAHLRQKQSLTSDEFLNVSITEAQLKPAPLHFNGLNAKTIPCTSKLMSNTLDLSYQLEDCLTLRLDYRTCFFEPSFMNQFLSHFFNLLDLCLKAPDKDLLRLDFFDETERNRLRSWENQALVAPTTDTVLSLFASQVQQTPKKTAVCFEDESLTYSQLNKASSAFAKRLLAHYRICYEHSLPKEALIGISYPKGLELVIAILSVLKAGAAFIPLDPTYPKERLKAMASDSAMALLISNTPSDFFPYEDKRVALSDLNVLEEEELVIETPSLSNLAYVLYTSGSTGNPKGVMIEHGSLSNVLLAFKQQLALGVKDCWASVTSPNFDIFGLELFLPLVTGCKLVLLSTKTLEEPLTLVKTLNALSPTVIQATPGFWSMMYLSGWPGDKKRLRVLTGGEALSSPLSAYLESIAKQAFNVYGPTETTIWSTCHLITPAQSALIIGKPILNTTVCVLDKAQQPVPVGVPGDLYIAGAGLARGYWNKTEKEMQKAFFNLAIEGEEQRFYKTGDLVTWTPDGLLEYIGRADSQVKIRGHRLELSEVEALILKHPKVWQCVVLTEGESHDKSLLAFVILKQQEVLDEAQLQDYLQQKLPTYAQPMLCFIDAFVLLPNGKIDKNAILKAVTRSKTKCFLKPKTTVEKTVFALWQELFPKKTLSMDDHFFKLGGHSLQAVHLAVRLGDLLGLDVPVQKIRQYPTIQGLASWLSLQQSTKSEVPLLPTAMQQGPLSLSQRYLWVIDKTEEEGALHYNLIIAQRLHGPLNLKALTDSVNGLLARHEALRTIYKEVKGEILQLVEPFKPLELSILKSDESSLQTRLRREVQTPFKLDESPSLRVRLYGLSDTQTVLVFCLPHIATDGWSLNTLKEELNLGYQNALKGKQPNLKPCHYQYLDFVAWQAKSLQEAYLAKLESFWQKNLDGWQSIALPIDKPRAPVFSHKGDVHRFQINQAITGQLQSLALSQNVTLFSICLSAFTIVLSRYSNQDDLIIGTASANRGTLQFEDTVGLFVNTLALRLKLNNESSVSALFQEAMDVTMAAQDHQALPFEAVVDLLKANRDASRPPLVQVMLVLQTTNAQYPLELEGLRAEVIPVDTSVSKFELMLTLHETKPGLEAEVEYASDLFTTAFVERFAGHFNEVLEGFIDSTSDPVSKLNLLTLEEKQLLLSQWNRPAFECSCAQTLNQLFALQVAKQPGKCALRFGNESLSYQQLEVKANQLAHHLLQRSKGYSLKDTLIGLCLDKEPAMIVALLAVLKVGAAYVPLDPNYPTPRLSFIIEDSALSLIISRQCFIQEHQFDELVETAQLIDLDELSWDKPCTIVQVNHQTEDLAYVIYTSGSTGEPKGALMSHANVTSLMASTNTLFDFDESDVWCLFHSVAFDFSVWEIWGALLYGATLVIVPYEISRNTKAFRQLLHDEKVTVLNQTPSAFSKLIQEETRADNPLALRYVIFGGEALNARALEPWIEKYGALTPALINMYGITETTVHVTWYQVTKQDIEEGYSATIGKPLPHLKAYVLDRFGQLSPVGVPGELFISGPGLARGYLNREALTQKAFKTGKDNIRRYKTGDLVRWLPTGELEYLGRLDKQIKINGFRIETGEIEALLLQHKAIKEALVTVSKDKRLIAYYTTNAQVFDEEQLDNYLRFQLPEYMVPSAYILLQHFPMTVNGKVDFASLPLPGRKQKIQVAPRNTIETRLVNIWREVLGVKDLSIDDNFFALGGDSLLTISVVTRAQEEGLNLTAKSIVRYPTIASLALHCNTNKLTLMPKVAPFALLHEADKRQLLPHLEDAYPLTQLQKGMVYHSEINQESSAYTDVISCYLSGNFNLDVFNQALGSCVAQHPVLRTSFDWSRFSTPLQLVQSHINFSCKVLDWQQSEDKEQQRLLERWLSEEIKTHFDLKNPPLWRITFHKLKDQYTHFALTCHHGILDGWSVALLMTQLFECYEAHLLEKAKSPKPLQAQFSQYVACELQRVQAANQREFWQTKLQNLEPSMLSQQSSVTEVGTLQRVFLEISESLSARFFEVAKTHQTGVDTLFLAVHIWVLGLLLGQESPVTGTATHGRPDSKEGDKVLGLFLNSTPFSSRIESSHWSEVIQHIIQEKAQILEFQQYPLSNIQALNANQPLFDTLFNFVNFHVFDALKGLQTLTITPGRTYEETNYSLVAQTGIRPDTKQLEYQLIILSNRLNHEQIEVIQALYQKALYSIANEEAVPKRDTLCEYFSWMKHNKEEKSDFGHHTIHALFDEQVQATPHRVALIDEEGSMTYLELWEKASSMACALQQQALNQYQKPLNPESIIGVRLEPGRHLISALLAILKVGAAYLPLDKAYQEERLAAMVAYASPCFILVDETFVVKEAQSLCIPIASLSSQELDSTLTALTHEKNLAYVMFTSGSTGEPKAVMIEHRSVVRLVKNTNYIKIEPDDVIAQASNPNFDAFTFEVWGALLNGASVVCVPRATLLNARAFAHFLLQEKVSILWLTARLLDQYIASGFASMFKHLRYLLAGGDILNKSTLTTLFNCEEGRPIKVLNGYGPTENTTFSTVFNIAKESLNYPSIPIGSPISQTQVYVLSSRMKPIPLGFEGELYLGGLGLARGYLNNETLTAQRFVVHPFKEGELVYKTGDKVIALQSGELLFLGRRDRQLKIRGFRIELDEIERLLLTHANITQCVIVAKEGNGDKQLVAYCVTEGEISLESLWTDFRQTIPSHLLPTRIVLIDALPLTPNGKLCLTGLPEVELDLPQLLTNPDASTEIELRIQAIWCQVLGVSSLSIKDNFFDVGGNSLLVVQLHTLIQESFEGEISVTDLFHYPTIQSFAAFLSGHHQQKNTRDRDIQAKRRAFRHQQRLKNKRPEHV